MEAVGGFEKNEVSGDLSDDDEIEGTNTNKIL